MTRPEITAELSTMIEKKINPNNDPRIYWAKEVTFDYSTNHAVRVDYMKFVPVNNSVSGIEKGDCYCYEIKSFICEERVSDISFVTEIIWEGFANTDSSEALKKQFDKFCDWCWGHGYGDCDVCRKEYHKLYIPLKIAEKQRELGLEETRRLY